MDSLAALTATFLSENAFNPNSTQNQETYDAWKDDMVAGQPAAIGRLVLPDDLKAQLQQGIQTLDYELIGRESQRAAIARFESQGSPAFDKRWVEAQEERRSYQNSLCSPQALDIIDACTSLFITIIEQDVKQSGIAPIDKTILPHALGGRYDTQDNRSACRMHIEDSTSYKRKELRSLEYILTPLGPTTEFIIGQHRFRPIFDEFCEWAKGDLPVFTFNNTAITRFNDLTFHRAPLPPSDRPARFFLQASVYYKP